MKITTIEKPRIKTALTAWNLSRHDSGEKVESILKVDAPVNDFPSMVLHIESTIIEREVFSTMKDHVMWARTSRVDDIKKFTVDKNYDVNAYAENRKKMFDGDRQDDYRMFLPLVANTAYTVRISIRSLSKVGNYFFKLSKKFPEHEDLFYGAYRAIELCMFENRVEVGYKPIEIFDEIDLWDSGMIGDVCTETFVVPFSLRAQVVRAHLLSVTDTMLSDILPNLADATLGSTMSIQVTGTRSVWRGLISKRSCWMAQMDLWGVILNKVSKVYKFDKDILPCSGGSCPFETDAKLRATDNDPNAPCPKYVQISGNTLSGQDKIDIAKQIESESRPNFWKSI